MRVEAAAWLPWYEELFTDEQRAVARRRLVEHRFDVDSMVEQGQPTHLTWTTEP